MTKVRALELTAADLEREGCIRRWGRDAAAIASYSDVTARDLEHTVQISRVMAKRYREEARPFKEFLSLMR